jgi:Protein of unknown function (DUF3828)
MRRTIITALVFSTILLASASVMSIAQHITGTSVGSPETVVAELYKLHERHQSPFSRPKNRALFDRFFDKKLSGLVWTDMNSHPGEIGVIDFDPLYSAQDIKIKNFKVQKARIDGTSAEVPVSFTNYGRAEKLTFKMVSHGGAWKISDIRYTEGATLLEMFNDNQTHMFQGAYKVGETSCNVKPVKMAFEIRWAKGKGAMIFFFDSETEDGKYIYASEDKGAGQDKFIFDSDRFDSGRFIRADGKEYSVSRL